MKIDQIRLCRHFIRDDGTEETIELTTSTKLLHESAVKDAVTQLRIELEQFDDTGMIVDDIRSQVASAKDELAAVIRRLNAAIYRLENMRERLEMSGFTNEEITSLLMPVTTENVTD